MAPETGSSEGLDGSTEAASRGYMKKILVLNGPNLNLLGRREPDVYGYRSLTDIAGQLEEQARQAGVAIEFLQSNAEHVLIDRVQGLLDSPVDFLILNPGAFTHTSIALRDAVAAAAVPFIEVHLSNIHAREPFRRQSYFSDLAAGSIVGLGAEGYSLALQAALGRLRAASHQRS